MRVGASDGKERGCLVKSTGERTNAGGCIDPRTLAEWEQGREAWPFLAKHDRATRLTQFRLAHFPPFECCCHDPLRADHPQSWSNRPPAALKNCTPNPTLPLPDTRLAQAVDVQASPATAGRSR